MTFPNHIIRKALCSLCSSGAQFHEKLADTVRHFGVKPSYADPNVCYCDAGDCYKYICTYVDDLLVAMKDPNNHNVVGKAGCKTYPPMELLNFLHDKQQQSQALNEEGLKLPCAHQHLPKIRGLMPIAIIRPDLLCHDFIFLVTLTSFLFGTSSNSSFAEMSRPESFRIFFPGFIVRLKIRTFICSIAVMNLHCG